MEIAYKKVDDFLWKGYLKEIIQMEHDVKKLNDPYIKDEVKEKICSDLRIKFTDEMENKILRDRLS